MCAGILPELKRMKLGDCWRRELDESMGAGGNGYGLRLDLGW